MARRPNAASLCLELSRRVRGVSVLDRDCEASQPCFANSGIARSAAPTVSWFAHCQVPLREGRRPESVARDAAGRGDDATIERIAGEVRELTAAFLIPGARV